ncbi:MAG: ABC transporter permease [Chloroflexi bacterium]|nr:ABC transporter permease [Chloroflexota bacterium]
MNTKRIGHLARRVVLQVVSDRRTLALILVVPVILLTVAGVLIRVEPGEIRIGVVNEDEGVSLSDSVVLGDRLTSVFTEIGTFEAVQMNRSEADAALDEGEVDAVIYLPPTFTQDVMSTRTLTLNVQFEGSNPMLAERLNSMLERVSGQATNTVASASTGGIALDTNIEATYLHGGPEFDTLDYMAPALIGVFVFLFVFILTSIAFLRERLAGTLERLRATPIRPSEIIVGYMMGFLVFALLQGLITLLFTILVLNVHYTGNLLNVFIVETLLAITSVNLGIFLSTFARNEFQVLQFIPLVVVTQVFLGGVFWEVSAMPDWLQPVAYLMPLTHANIALRDIMLTGATLLDEWQPLLAMLAIIVAVIALSSRTAAQARI